MHTIYEIYKSLFNHYGPQGWWPYMDVGYHKGEYSFPKNKNQVLEVALGSILTQNTTFVSVVKALDNLKELDCLTSASIKAMDIDVLKTAIKPAGYFNQKADYILNFLEFYESLDGDIPSREELLKVKGIGEETADSTLLYGYNQTEFKVDAYTKRFLLELELIDAKAKYKDIKKLFESSLESIETDKEKLRIIYQEYHALIVEHGKHFYSKKPYGVGCFLREKYNRI